MAYVPIYRHSGHSKATEIWLGTYDDLSGARFDLYWFDLPPRVTRPEEGNLCSVLARYEDGLFDYHAYPVLFKDPPRVMAGTCMGRCLRRLYGLGFWDS